MIIYNYNKQHIIILYIVNNTKHDNTMKNSIEDARLRSIFKIALA